ncbi:MAG: hypothetical protein RQ867_09940 [Mariprofundaceae bacterium]|nr:hypothetical protein [Mariprofundaceae bacterium]
MAIKQPGTASQVTFLITAFWALVMVAVLVSGHLVLAFLAYSKFTGGKGIEEVAAFTSLPAWALWLSIVAALALDGWILYHQRKERQKALKR